MKLENTLKKAAKKMRSPFDLTRRTFLKIAGAGVLASQFPISFKGISKAHASSEYTYAFPHFVNNNNWVTGITLTNPNSQKANLNLKAYNIHSNIIAEKDYILNPHASLSNKVDNILDVEGAGDIIINSDKPLTGQETFTPLYGQYYGNMSSLLLSAENDTIIYFPHIASSDKWWTGLAFCNPNSLDTLVRLTMIDTLGNEVGYNEVEVPPYSQAPAQLARDLFSDGFPLNTTGFVKAESDLPINGLEIFMGYPKGMAGLNAVPHKELSNTLYFPHFASGNYWWTGLGICNPNNEEAIVDFKAYSQEGNLNSETQEIINPNAQMTPRVVKKLFQDLSVEEGWIEATSNQPIAGLEIFGTPDGNIAGLNACTNPSKQLYFPKVVDGKNLYSEANPLTVTGLAFVNPNNEPATINAKAYDDNGNLTDSKNIILNSNESKPQMSYELSPNLKDGHIELNSNKDIIGLQIYIDKNSNISGTLAARIKKSNPKTGRLEDLLYGGVIGNALIKFYELDDVTEIDETRADSNGEFSIPTEARRIEVFHNDYITRATNVLTNLETTLFKLISNNESSALAIYKECFLNPSLGGKLQKPIPGEITQFYIDTSKRYTTQTIPYDWINAARTAIAKAQEAYPEGIGSASIVEGINPPIHYINEVMIPNRGSVLIGWKDSLNNSAYHIEYGDDVEYANNAPLEGGEITAGKIYFGTGSILSRYKYHNALQEVSQVVLGARMDTNSNPYANTVFTPYYGTKYANLTSYSSPDNKAIKIMRNRPLAHELETIDYDPII